MQRSQTQMENISRSAFLVTGGAGFIGSHIAEYLLKAGARKVRVLDNLATGHFRNMACFANDPRFEFTLGDIRDADDCKAACKEIDYVFHHAAWGTNTELVKNTTITQDVNVNGFFNMLVAAQEAGVKRFVYAANDLVYGDHDQLHSMETIGLRYHNVFGRRHDPHSVYAAVIPGYVSDMIAHKTPVIHEEDACDFCYIEDAVQANMAAVFATRADAINQVYDIAYEEKVPLHQLALYLREFLSVFDQSIADLEVQYDSESAQPVFDALNLEKTREVLHFQPQFSLWNGLLQSVSWYWAYLPQFELEARQKKQRNLSSTSISI
jgi:Nucleoside-diphosphate-sugar epimerases